MKEIAVFGGARVFWGSDGDEFDAKAVPGGDGLNAGKASHTIAGDGEKIFTGEAFHGCMMAELEKLQLAHRLPAG